MDVNDDSQEMARLPVARRSGADRGSEYYPSTDYPGERRISGERRRYRTSTFWRGLIDKRRRKIRRGTDGHRFHLDWHEPWLLAITLAILLASALDALMTLELLRKGAVEVNPFMAALIKKDVGLFVNAKLALTGLGLILLVMHANFRVFRVIRISYILSISLLIYLGLTGYELVLLGYLPGP